MDWIFRSDLPIYTQLAERLTELIISGAFGPGERLPAVRELAMEAGVNPNTVQRALSDLERDGLVYTQRTAGRFVTEDNGMIERAKQHLADEKISAFLATMRKLGCSTEQVIQLITQMEEGETHGNSGM